MKRWAAPALAIVTILAAATDAAARHRGGGGGKSFGGGISFRGRHGGANLRFGFGSRFGHGRFSPHWGYPGYGFGGYPGYGFGGYPGFGLANFGYGFGYPAPVIPLSPVDVYLPYWYGGISAPRYNLPYANYNSGPNYVELPPRVTVIERDPAYEPRVTDGSARLERGGERYYLDPHRTEPEPAPQRPSTLKEALRDNLRIESADKDQYLVRWTGDPSELVALELTALDADRKVVMRRLIKAPPFRGLLNTGGKTTMVTLSIDVKDGPTVTLEYPLERFQALARSAAGLWGFCTWEFARGGVSACAWS